MYFGLINVHFCYTIRRKNSLALAVCDVILISAFAFGELRRGSYETERSRRMEDLMSHPVIVADDCVSCGACVDACPADVLELGDECAEVVDADSCIACGACMDACPTGAITEIVDD